MKKRIALLFILFLLFSPFAQTAQADIGPKPSVRIDFTGMEGEEYYVTLLLTWPSTGPYSYHKDYADEKESKAGDRFQEIGSGPLYFLGYYEDCTKSHQFKWTYYPPTEFIVAIYHPKTQQVYLSEETFDAYAFNTTYVADLSDFEFAAYAPTVQSMDMVANYNYFGEIGGFLARMIATIAIELGIARLFGFRSREQFRLIVIANMATQGFFNLIFQFVNYKAGYLAFFILYILLEIFVFLIEGIIYHIRMPRTMTEPVSRLKIWLYTLSANAVSFGVGIAIAYLMILIQFVK
ncbi:MAG: hypothetical protein Q4G61_05575 [Tissierellia bacterium]|nr:hypothetical protein [Tissierellia bacterium]